MQVKIHTDEGWQPAEQLELDIVKCCGSCRRWDPEDQTKRPSSLRSIGKGTCRLSGKARHADDMHGCFAWALADEDGIKRREGKE